MAITTNGHYREIGYGEPSWSNESEPCFRYTGDDYYLSEFMRIEHNGSSELDGWCACLSDTAFSGIVIKLSDNQDSIIVGRYIE